MRRSPSSPEPVEAAIAQAQQIAGGLAVNVTAGVVAGQCLELGLLDEVAIDLVPGCHGWRAPFLRRHCGRGRSARQSDDLHSGRSSHPSHLPGDPLTAADRRLADALHHQQARQWAWYARPPPARGARYSWSLATLHPGRTPTGFPTVFPLPYRLLRPHPSFACSFPRRPFASVGRCRARSRRPALLCAGVVVPARTVVSTDE